MPTLPLGGPAEQMSVERGDACAYLEGRGPWGSVRGSVPSPGLEAPTVATSQQGQEVGSLQLWVAGKRGVGSSHCLPLITLSLPGGEVERCDDGIWAHICSR